MSSVEKTSPSNAGPPVKTAQARQLDTITWALFLIWIGVAVLANVGWGWALLGMSAIILGAQATVWRQAETVDVPDVCDIGSSFLQEYSWTAAAHTLAYTRVSNGSSRAVNAL